MTQAVLALLLHTTCVFNAPVLNSMCSACA